MTTNVQQFKDLSRGLGNPKKRNLQAINGNKLRKPFLNFPSTTSLSSLTIEFI